MRVRQGRCHCYHARIDGIKTNSSVYFLLKRTHTKLNTITSIIAKTHSETSEQKRGNVHETADQHAYGASQLSFDQWQLFVGYRGTNARGDVAVIDRLTTVLQDSRVIRLEGWNTSKCTADFILEVTFAKVADEQLIEVNHHAGKSETEH